MKRSDFIRTCGLSCIGAVLSVPVLESCKAGSLVNGVIEGRKLKVPLASFDRVQHHNSHFRRFIIVHHDQLNYPIVIYRKDELRYTALLLRCSHQYNELNVSGDLLSCPAHGSEFNSDGEVINGPAGLRLRSFPVSKQNHHLIIDLS